VRFTIGMFEVTQMRRLSCREGALLIDLRHDDADLIEAGN
jgi:hypothetical protein